MKSLYAILGDSSIAALRAMAPWWGTEPPNRDDAESRQKFERSIRDTVASRFVWERLEDDERRVLYAIVGPSARNWQITDSVPERAGLPAEVALPIVRKLIDNSLAFTEIARTQNGELLGQRATFYGYSSPRNLQSPVEERAIVYVPTELATGLYTTGRELFLVTADRSEKTLDELLMPYRQGDLDQIGRRFGLMMQSFYSRNEVRAAMAENLTQAEAVRYALTRVEPLMRDVYEWLRAAGGIATTLDLRKRFALDDIALSHLLHALEEYALIFDTFSAGRRVVFIPRETLTNLRKAETRPQIAAGLKEIETPRAIRPSDPTFLWDLVALTASAAQQDIELTRSGALPKRAAQRLLSSLVSDRAHGAESEALSYVDMLKQEATELGIVSAPPSRAQQRARLTLASRMESWGKHDLVMQARRLFKRWPTDRWWQDVPGAGYKEWLSFYVELPLAREAVGRLLRECQPGVWYSLESFRTTLKINDPYVLRPSQRCAGEAGFKLAEELAAHWDETDGRIITGMFRSTLYELGFVSLGYDRDAPPTSSEDVNPDAFALTELGYEALTSELSASVQTSPRSLVVQPNYQVILLEPHMPTLYWLARHANLEQVGRASRFTFTKESLLRGLELGSTIEDVVRFLETHSNKSLPQNVIFMLRDWAKQQTAPAPPVPTLVLEFHDERVTDLVITSPKLKAFNLRRVGPKKVIAPSEISPVTLWQALHRHGFGKRLKSGLEDFAAAAAAKQASASGRPSGAPAPALKNMA
ncbi:MAG TPA: helicase-associated domain-containing protein [Ktedonobacterales bacterium]